MPTYIFDYDENRNEELKFEHDEDCEIQRFEKNNKSVLYFKDKNEFRLIYIEKYINDGNIKSFRIKFSSTYEGDLISNIEYIEKEILDVMNIRQDFYSNIIMSLKAMSDFELDLTMDYIKHLKSLTQE